MGHIPTPEEAKALLAQYNKEAFHIKHGEIVSGVLRYFAAEHDPGREDFWSVVGLLHDLDFEEYPEDHCIKVRSILEELGYDEALIRAVESHGWGCTDVTVQPESTMEKILYATDELTGLIGAVAIMRPSRSVDDLELKSVKKKYKTPSFAAGCSRDVIEQGAAMLGWELDDLIERTIHAMRSLNPEAGI